MHPFTPVSDADLARARRDPAFRQQLLAQNLEILLGKLQTQRQARRSAVATSGQIREGVTLAVRLAELIQASVDRVRSP